MNDQVMCWGRGWCVNDHVMCWGRGWCMNDHVIRGREVVRD